MSANPTVLWADPNRYNSPADEEIDVDGIGNNDGDPDGKGGYNKPVLTSQRFGHELFVQRLTNIWQERCALTNLKAPRLVQACHIVPWSEATPAERVCSDNGLLLCAHLHALFDSHLLGFDIDGHLLLAHNLDENVRSLVLSSGAVRLRKSPTEAQATFLRRHKEIAHEAQHHLVRV